jgi:hypothetical protein
VTAIKLSVVAAFGAPVVAVVALVWASRGKASPSKSTAA